MFRILALSPDHVIDNKTQGDNFFRMCDRMGVGH